MKETQKQGIESCPHCGGKSGYYRKLRVSGIIFDNHTFSGVAENTNMHDTISYQPLSDYQRCIDCNKIIKEL